MLLLLCTAKCGVMWPSAALRPLPEQSTGTALPPRHEVHALLLLSIEELSVSTAPCRAAGRDSLSLMGKLRFGAAIKAVAVVEAQESGQWIDFTQVLSQGRAAWQLMPGRSLCWVCL